MAHRSGPRLRGPITLPSGSMIESAHLRLVLGASTAVLHTWRKNYGFPNSYRDSDGIWYTLTDSVAAWAARLGVEVRRV